jgi:iron complex transport system ATP-binding protein
MTLSADGLTVAGRLEAADVVLRPGELVAICGPNGAGKSTLLGALSGLVAPSFGTEERARTIGYLPQTGEVAWDIDVATLAGLGRLPWRSSAGEDREAVAEALTALDLVTLADRPVSRLSGGERARALLARVLAGRPRWVLADEPLAALDLGHQRTLLAHFSRLAEEGVGVVLVLHDLALAMNHADRVVLLDRGRVAADGPPDAVLDPDRLAEIWGVSGAWLGPSGARALSLNR